MLQKIQKYLEEKQKKVKEQEQLKKAQAYYRLVKAGNAFIQFVQQDMAKNKEEVNRHVRRRMEKELNEKGVLTPELVNYYQQKIDYVLYNISMRLNPPKQPKVQQQNSNIQVRTTKPEGTPNVA
jgi:hypothetical protein